MPRRLIAVAAVAVLALGACDTDTPTTTEATTTTTEAAPTTTQPPATTSTTTTTVSDRTDAETEALYVDFMRGLSLDYPVITWVDVYSDAQVVAFGRTACDLFDDYGGDFEAVITGALLFLEGQFGDAMVAADYELAGAAIGAGTAAFCPQWADALDEWSGSWPTS